MAGIGVHNAGIIYNVLIVKRLFQIQLNDNTRINSENTALKKELQKLNRQIGTLETNHKEALKLSYDELAQDTENNFAKQIDAWKIQSDKSQGSLVAKEKEWKKSIMKTLIKLINYINK